MSAKSRQAKSDSKNRSTDSVLRRNLKYIDAKTPDQADNLKIEKFAVILEIGFVGFDWA